MNKVERWMKDNGYLLPGKDDLEDSIVEMKFGELFELMELYALQHHLNEFKAEIDKIFRQQ